MSTVAERVTLARTKRGLNKSDLADRANLSSGYLTQLEAPREGASIKQPGIEVIERLATALDVPVGWLAFGTEPEPTWPDELKPKAAS
jgi:transcriptional regulator with XRE-family HTH domain